MDRKIISKIVKASGVSSGEMILIHFWGEDADKEIANNFMAAAAEIGATPVLLQQSRSVNRDIFLAAKKSCYGEQYFDLFTKFDAVLDVFAYRPVILGYEIDKDKFELYRRYMAKLFSKLMNCKRFTQIRIPTAANAEESGLNPQDYIQRMEEHMTLITLLFMRPASRQKTALRESIKCCFARGRIAGFLLN